MERKQFTFYRSFWDSIKKLPKKEQGNILISICSYALDDIIPSNQSAVAETVFTLIRPNLDASRRKAESGQRGGNREANGKQSGSEPEANDKQSGSEIEKEVEIEIEVEKEVENKCYSSARFVKPTIEEVHAYCLERGNSIDAESFIDFYESKGWKIGKEPMKDWQAAVRTWEKRRAPQQQKHKSWAEIAEQLDEEDRLKAGGGSNDA